MHRIGRTARAGANGDAISFCSAEDRTYLREIERLLGKPVPTDKEHAYHSDEAIPSCKPAPKNLDVMGAEDESTDALKEALHAIVAEGAIAAGKSKGVSPVV